MFNLTIYTPPYKNQSGKVMQALLRIHAENDFGYYKAYPYFSPRLSERKQLRLSDLQVDTCNELLARARRTITFSDVTKLRPVKFSKKHFGTLADRVHAAGSCDHLSYWESDWNTKFVLNEPYRVDPSYMNKLEAQGLVAIELPVDISPYCGRWDPNLGARPWTRSFLICDADDLDELESLFAQYYERIQISFDGWPDENIVLIPVWNSLGGINHA